MEASPILNLATASQAPPPSTGPAMSAKPEDAGNVPSFAQVVREILVRTTTQSDTQPAHTLQSSSSARSGKQGTLSGVSRESWPAVPVQPTNTPATNAVSLVNQCAVILPVAPVSPDSEGAATANSQPSETAIPSSAAPTPASSAVSNQIIPPPAFPDPVSGSAANQLQSSEASGTPAPGSDPSFIVPDQPTALGSPDRSTQNEKNLGAANQLPAFDVSGVAIPLSQQPASGIPDARPVADSGKLASALQVAAPNLPDALPLSRDAKAVAADQFAVPAYPDPAGSVDSKNAAADQQQANAIYQTSDPSSVRKTTTDPQIPVDLPSTPNATTISFLSSVSASWQSGATLNSSTAGGASSTVAHAASPQVANKVALSSTQLAASLPVAFVPQVSGAKSVPSTQAVLPPVAPPANGPSSGRSGSQENSSNAGTQKASDSSTTPSPAVPRDTPAFSQAFAATNDVKPQAGVSTENQTPVTPAVTIPLNDRPAAPAVASLPTAPANPPETTSRILDAVPNPTVTDAQISQNSNHSEMRIAMQTDKLGAVELHARVSGDEIGAAITVEKRDAHAALAVELPALQQALSDKQFRVDQITLLHSSLHSTTGDGSGQSQAQQGDRGTHRAQAAQSFLRHNSGAFISFQAVTENRGIFDSQGRLSVQA